MKGIEQKHLNLRYKTTGDEQSGLANTWVWEGNSWKEKIQNKPPHLEMVAVMWHAREASETSVLLRLSNSEKINISWCLNVSEVSYKHKFLTQHLTVISTTWHGEYSQHSAHAERVVQNNIPCSATTGWWMSLPIPFKHLLPYQLNSVTLFQIFWTAKQKKLLFMIICIFQLLCGARDQALCSLDGVSQRARWWWCEPLWVTWAAGQPPLAEAGAFSCVNSQRSEMPF